MNNMRLAFVVSLIWFLHWLCLILSSIRVIIAESLSQTPSLIGSWTSIWDYLVTLAHEMVHVKQRVKGEWGQKVDGTNTWHKKIVSPFTKYWDEPWEIDARAWERYIANRAIYEGIVTLK